jgi:isoprenylcysteine carboxyl methyltransferase (ICMT) family protein YpbQ
MFAVNAWNTTLAVWEAIAALWIITAVIERVVPEPSQPHSLFGYLHIVFMIPAFALLMWPRNAIGPFGRILFHSNPLGLALVFAGAAIAGLARLELGANWSSHPRIRAAHTLSTSGPYRVVRHPIYSGLLLSFLGSAIVLGQLRGYLGFAIAFLTWLLKSRVEDRMLAERFGPEFIAYRRHTKGLIPGIL